MSIESYVCGVCEREFPGKSRGTTTFYRNGTTHHVDACPEHQAVRTRTRFERKDLESLRDQARVSGDRKLLAEANEIDSVLSRATDELVTVDAIGLDAIETLEAGLGYRCDNRD
jgi:hypothetical protein